jgi:hypothetical protein
MGMGYFAKCVKDWVDRMDACVRSMGELLPLWLSILEDVRPIIKDQVA